MPSSAIVSALLTRRACFHSAGSGAEPGLPLPWTGGVVLTETRGVCNAELGVRFPPPPSHRRFRSKSEPPRCRVSSGAGTRSAAPLAAGCRDKAGAASLFQREALQLGAIAQVGQGFAKRVGG